MDPSAQSTGVGSAMLKWVTEFADEKGASCWIHLSDHPGGPALFEKAGFKVVNTLALDLDEWTKTKKEPRWGIYTFRYYRRPAKGE